MLKNENFLFEFHIAGHIRSIYDFNEFLFASAGNIIFANFVEVRNFVFLYNKNKEEEKKIDAGLVNSAGLLDEIYHFVISSYQKEVNPNAINKLLTHLETRFTSEKIYDLLFDFTSMFPPKNVYNNKVPVTEYLEGATEGRANLEISLEELILLHFDNFNPAHKPLEELINEKYLSDHELYRYLIEEIDKYFETQPKYGPENQDLFTMLRAPILKHPEDPEAQLEYIQEKWSQILGKVFLKKLLKSKDFIKENRQLEMGWGGTVPTNVPHYKPGDWQFEGTLLGKSGFDYGRDILADYEEYEKFTPDIDWMPRVVLMAKNIHVWLDQLSKKYEREIQRLDQIPDEELDQLVRWGFNGLWMIGLWERSRTSRKIKHIMGNIDATASAYSLFDYEIAYDLGGEEAYNNLNYRARKRGLRLASDMVPNHTGIFSRWVLDNPHFFIQSDNPPFPNYKFTGEDLSDDPRIQLRLEDGYFSKSDAAVVFQRIDNNTGDVKYLYHGNDGTNMPWNDTAQLNLLRGDVREAVIQKIFDVARKFSIIRFDAAMTLTKKHFSRLWYPQPGTGGDIPSRADHAMTREEFDKQFPLEFWREVVDRINKELPETLLLAEAFWLMEGYFVRTLGMHRVYNSAFMNMLMREENEKYRDLITNTLEFEPEILKRYVNFMSNPDEETAIKQFGTDDKYFGVLVLMVTLPGLPMFAHGQIEGFNEKYGMEYQRAYYNESPKQWLIDRHEREIFPLLKKRYVYSGVDDFWLFDFIDSFGAVNENVFAYCNSYKDEKSLVLYNNKYEQASGAINYSAPKLVNGDNKSLKKVAVAEALGIKNETSQYYSYRELISGREYLITGAELWQNGFIFTLNGFEYRIFENFREVNFDKQLLDKVRGIIGVYGTDKMNELIIRVKYEFLFEKEKLILVSSSKLLQPAESESKTAVNEVENLQKQYKPFLEILEKESGLVMPKQERDFTVQVKVLHEILQNIYYSKFTGIPLSGLIGKYFNDYSLNLVSLYLLDNIKYLLQDSFDEVFPRLNLNLPISDLLYETGMAELHVQETESLLYALLEHSKTFTLSGTIADEDELPGIVQKLYESLITRERIKFFLNVNEHEGILYFSKEKFEEFILEIILVSFFRYCSSHFLIKQGDSVTGKKGRISIMKKALAICDKMYTGFSEAAENSGYDYIKLIESEIEFLQK